MRFLCLKKGLYITINFPLELFLLHSINFEKVYLFVCFHFQGVQGTGKCQVGRPGACNNALLILSLPFAQAAMSSVSVSRTTGGGVGVQKWARCFLLS